MYEILSTLKLTIKFEIRNFSEIIFFQRKVWEVVWIGIRSGLKGLKDLKDLDEILEGLEMHNTVRQHEAQA